MFYRGNTGITALNTGISTAITGGFSYQYTGITVVIPVFSVVNTGIFHLLFQRDIPVLPW